MEKTLAQIIPLAIGATFSPSGLLLVMGILSSEEKPRRKALAFLAGAALFLIVLGLVILFILKPAVHQGGHNNRLSAYIDISLGLLIVLIVIRMVLTKKKDKPEKKKRKIPYGAVGFSFMIVNTSTLVLFIAACKIISEGKLGMMDSLVLFAILLLITMFMIAFPVLISYAMPQRSQVVLRPVTAFMSKHGSRIAQIYFLIMAVYLVVHGILMLSEWW